MRSQQGFTLIELMIVVAIIAVLAAIALPAYRTYLVRTQVSEASTLVTAAENAIATYHSQYGAFPADNEAAGLASPASISGKYVTSVAIDNTGLITATFGGDSNAQISGQALLMQAQDNGGSLQWTCAGLPRQYLPSQC